VIKSYALRSSGICIFAICLPSCHTLLDLQHVLTAALMERSHGGFEPISASYLRVVGLAD